MVVNKSIAYYNLRWINKDLYLRNRKHFPCFHTVIEAARVEV